MKKLILTMLTILTCGAAYALPMGNPADPVLLTSGVFWDDDCCDPCPTYDPCDPCGWWNWDMFGLRIGYYGDFVFNRDLEIEDFSEDNIEHFEIYTNAGLVVLNLWDRLDIFGTFGGTEMYLETNAVSFRGPIGERFELETDTHFSWSVGGKLALWECGCTTIGLDGRYFRANPDIRRITVGGDLSVYPDDTLETRYREWQVGIGIAHRINMFVPYFGVKYSHARLELEDGDLITIGATTFTLPELENRHKWGYVFGVTLVDCERMSLTVEGRLRDEKAVHVNAQIRF